MYKQIAAYAAALIRQDMCPAQGEGEDPYFGIKADGTRYLGFAELWQLTGYTWYGAVHHAWQTFTKDTRPYSKVSTLIYRYAWEMYQSKPHDLTLVQMETVLLTIARG